MGGAGVAHRATNQNRVRHGAKLQYDHATALLYMLSKITGIDKDELVNLFRIRCVTRETIKIYEEIYRSLSHLLSLIIVRSDGKVVYSTDDPVVAGNHVLLPDALAIGERELCLCGGGTCSSSPPRICYDTQIVDVYGKYVCSNSYIVARFIGYVIGTYGEPTAAQRAFVGIRVVHYDPATKTVIYEGAITPTTSGTLNYVGLGVRPSLSALAGCCASCPPNTALNTYIMVVAFAVNIPAQAGYRYIVRVRLSLSV